MDVVFSLPDDLARKLQNLGSASEAILSENYRSIVAAENMINGLERMDSAVLLPPRDRGPASRHER
jgi:hypothetical protein